MKYYIPKTINNILTYLALLLYALLHPAFRNRMMTTYKHIAVILRKRKNTDGVRDQLKLYHALIAIVSKDLDTDRKISADKLLLKSFEKAKADLMADPKWKAYERLFKRIKLRMDKPEIRTYLYLLLMEDFDKCVAVCREIKLHESWKKNIDEDNNWIRIVDGRYLSKATPAEIAFYSNIEVQTKILKNKVFLLKNDPSLILMSPEFLLSQYLNRDGYWSAMLNRMLNDEITIEECIEIIDHLDKLGVEILQLFSMDKPSKDVKLGPISEKAYKSLRDNMYILGHSVILKCKGKEEEWMRIIKPSGPCPFSPSSSDELLIVCCDAKLIILYVPKSAMADHSKLYDHIIRNGSVLRKYKDGSVTSLVRIYKQHIDLKLPTPTNDTDIL